jgi:DNA-directed RNA polymerase subunit RPC12/RpoP
MNRKEYNREYYDRNKDKIKELNKKYREDHKEERKKYYEEHKQEIKERNKKYREDQSHKQEIKERNKKYREDHKDYMKKYVESHKEYIRIKTREYKLKKYGLTLSEFNAILLQQGYKCAICGKPLENRKQAHIDHNHKTGKVRGILCNQCNLLLGYAFDDPDILQNAQDYILAHSNTLFVITKRD